MTQSKKATTDLMKLVSEMEQQYWVPLLDTPLPQLEELAPKSATDCPQLHETFAAFHTNLSAAQSLVDFPYQLIMPLLPGILHDCPKSVQKKIETGKKLTEEEFDIVTQMVANALKAAHGHMSNIGNNSVLQLLLHQACLLIWGAMESFSKEVFRLTLNERPALLSALYKNPALKERFQISASSWQSILENHEFNLQGKLGNIIGPAKDFSSPQLLCDLFPTMLKGMRGPGFPNKIFDHEKIKLLGQRRHLIAHRCSIVDKEYLSVTKDESQQLGQKLKLGVSEFLCKRDFV